MNRDWQPLSSRLAFVYVLCDRKVNIRIVGHRSCTAILSISMYFSELDGDRCFGTAVALPPDQTTNPNTEDRKMRTDGQTIRGNEMVIPHVDLESVKEWAKATFTKERIVDVAVCASTVTVFGVILSTLYRALETRTILGF